MRKPVAAFEVYCDGCSERFEYADYTFFSDVSEWLNESEWITDGEKDLCEECKWLFILRVAELAGVEA